MVLTPFFTVINSSDSLFSALSRHNNQFLSDVHRRLLSYHKRVKQFPFLPPPKSATSLSGVGRSALRTAQSTSHSILNSFNLVLLKNELPGTSMYQEHFFKVTILNLINYYYYFYFFSQFVTSYFNIAKKYYHQ